MGRYIRKEIELKQHKLKGYIFVNLKKNKFHETRLLHRLIAITFVPNPKNKPCINHIDGNKANNTYWNLEWCTQKENVRHAFRTGLSSALRGELHNNATLTESQAIEVRNSLESTTSLAKKYGVTKTAISYIKLRKTWKHLK